MVRTSTGSTPTRSHSGVRAVAVPTVAAPTIICVRGPSRSGKTELIRQLSATLAEQGLNVAYLKRTHHPLDLPGKGSTRVWTAGPTAMVIHGVDRVQVTLPPGERTAASLLSHVPEDIDLVLMETHSPEPYPTILACAADPAEDEDVLGRWALAGVESAVPAISAALLRLIPADRQLARALRSSVGLHGGHGCAGLILGTRLALVGVEALGIAVPDRMKRLIVVLETDRCAADGVQAVTGCRMGKRTLRLLDYGKLAATFIDQWDGRAVRVSARGDLRDRVARMSAGSDVHEAQREAYATMTPADLFDIRSVRSPLTPDDLPGRVCRRVRCAACGEEVSDGRDVTLDTRSFCRPCADQQSGAVRPGGTES